MKILYSLLIICALNFCITLPIPLRGIVEGFYGTPWTFEDRADLIKFSGKNKLNAYIYAPKDDPYHRDKWRLPYPEDKIEELKNLVKLSIENKVRFIFAVSPGLDLNFDGEQAKEDFSTLLIKLDSIYEIGCRDFAIFFDDISATQDSGKKQANFLNKLQDSLNLKYPDISPLITVPTEYWRTSMIDQQGNVKQYTGDFASTLKQEIIVLYTGDEVVCEGISDESYKKANDIYKRNLGIWWNYPVNDFLKTKLALGAIENLPSSNVNSIFFNPMGQVQLSKIALATGAIYAYSPDTYNANKSWNKVIDEQFGEISSEMKVFALHSRHMENSWAKAGSPDAPEFYELAHQTVLEVSQGKSVEFSKLIKLIEEMEYSAITLLQKLPTKILDECQQQLEQFRRIIYADRVAVESLQNLKLDRELITRRADITRYESVAILSENSAIKFIDEVIDLFKKYN